MLWLIVSAPVDTKFRHIPTFSPKKVGFKKFALMLALLDLENHPYIFDLLYSRARTGARLFLLMYTNETHFPFTENMIPRTEWNVRLTEFKRIAVVKFFPFNGKYFHFNEK